MKTGFGMMISGANSCLTFKTKKKMKKILFMVAAVALMAMVSCNKENANDAPQVKEPSVVVEFSASISMGAEDTNVKPQSSAATRTTVDFAKSKTIWEESDIIFINNQKFRVKELRNDGLSAVFVNVDDLGESFKAPYIAIYSGNDQNNTMTIPENQTAVAGALGVKVCAAAYSEDTTLKFKHTASILMFQVAKACQTVTISSDNALAGTVSMTPDGDDEIPTFSDGTKNTVTINGPFEVGKSYYVAVLPGTKANFVVRHDGYLSKNAASVSIKRSAVVDMKILPAPVESTYKLMGVGNDWTTGKVFYKDIDGFYLLKNVTFTPSTQFKFTTDGTWGRPITFEKGRWAFTYDFPNDNMTGISGAYDIWVDPTNNAICFVDKDSAKPAFTKQNKLVHILYEGTGNCGLYIQSPTTSVNNYNNSGAWGNFQQVYMKKTPSADQNFCAFPLPSNVVGVSAKFTIRVWGDKNKTYTMTIEDDKPFWGNSDNGGSYDLTSKIDIK